MDPVAAGCVRGADAADLGHVGQLSLGRLTIPGGQERAVIGRQVVVETPTPISAASVLTAISVLAIPA
jgi:hypothetical protein